MAAPKCPPEMPAPNRPPAMKAPPMIPHCSLSPRALVMSRDSPLGRKEKYITLRRSTGETPAPASALTPLNIAVWKAGEAGLSLEGSVVASDAMFPFPDGLVSAAEAGATACIQPGGSVRDEEVIAAADERDVAMVFTGRRHFRH